jgi:hypothetical protein
MIYASQREAYIKLINYKTEKHMRKITKNDLTDNYFNLQLNSMSVKVTSALSLGAIFAGFSLGSVVALLFIDSSVLVRIMFVLSVISSCLFILSVISLHGILENVQDMLSNLEFFETKKDKFREYAKIGRNSRVGGLLLIFGIICFWIILICSSFMYTLTFGIIMLVVFVPLLFYIFNKMADNSGEKETFSLLEGRKSDWTGIPLDYDDILE